MSTPYRSLRRVVGARVRPPERPDGPDVRESARPLRLLQPARVRLAAVHEIPLGMRQILARFRPRVALHAVERDAHLGGKIRRQTLRRHRRHRAVGGRAVQIPQRVGELARRIDALLHREQLGRARVRRRELRPRRDGLVGQVVASAARDRRVDQLARPARHLAPRLGVGALLVVQHEREHLVRRPREIRPRIGQRVPDRDVHRVHVVRLQHAPHARQERHRCCPPGRSTPAARTCPASRELGSSSLTS